MDRAHSFSPRRRAQFPYHNRPVPPPRPVYFSGPQTRSYASVARQRPQRPTWGWDSSRDRGSDVRREAAEPRFGLLIRKLYRVIKTVHHLQNVDPKGNRPPPRMIARMVDTLAAMIKPASPSQQTMDFIEGNAKNWGHTTCIILMEHYEACLEDFLGDIEGGPTMDWKGAFLVASRWAKRNLPRITREVLDHAEAVITARLEGTEPTQPLAPRPVAVTTQTETAACSLRSVTQPGPVQGSPCPEAGKRLSGQRQPVSKVSKANSTSQKEDWPLPSLGREPPREQRDTSRRVERAVGTTSMEDGHSQRQRPLIDLDSHAAVPQDPQLEVSLNSFIWQDSDDSDVLRVPIRTASQLEIERIFDELHAEEERDEAEALASQLAAAQVPQTSSQVADESVQQQGDVADEDEDIFELNMSFVTRHRTTTNKMVDWNLDVTKKWLFLGDSNLSRCPDFTNQDLQVDSFPGANFRHAESIIRRAGVQPGLVVEKVVLSMGINSRKNRPKETTIKNLQAAVRAIKNRFPYTQFWIVLTNFSPNLHQVEKQNLQTVNDHIHRNMPYIPLLPGQLFRTEFDDIHWTRETASAMLEHWISHLNSQSP